VTATTILLLTFAIEAVLLYIHFMRAQLARMTYTGKPRRRS
jgi:hypothetical protein